MSVKCIPPSTPLLYSKTGVCRGIQYFSYFCSKTLIVGTHKNHLYVLSKIKKKYQYFPTENFQFLQFWKTLYISRACFRNGLMDMFS